MSDFRPTTPPNTPEPLREMDEWMAREAQAAVDELHLTLREAGDKAREFAEGIRLIQEAFSDGEEKP